MLPIIRKGTHLKMKHEPQPPPLNGIRVIEMAGLAPAPYCGMILSDFGADIVLVDRIGRGGVEDAGIMPENPFEFGKRLMRVDLKRREGIDVVRRMIQDYDVLLEPYRPGVMESLGLGPEEAHSINPRLIYARLTGWGQDGYLARSAGHDMNYIALSGALSLFRRKGERPVPPCNILGDFAGGGMLCAMGILLALIERSKSGKGQVIDAAMLDGACYLSTVFYGLLANGLMSMDIGTNMLDGGAPFYQVYETKDGKFIAVGAIEPKFYAHLLEGMEIDPASVPEQYDTRKWPEMITRFGEIFKGKARDQWTEIFAGKDACVTPVLELDEVEKDRHNRKRNLLVRVLGVARPAPAPRLSRTPGIAVGRTTGKGSDSREVLKGLGYSEEEMKAFHDQEIVG
jgi:alpha-methylacyl-CoA racemase